jgi:hypothetical protein
MDGRVQRAGGALLAEINRGNGKDKGGAMTRERGTKLGQTVCTEVHENGIGCVIADRTGNISDASFVISLLSSPVSSVLILFLSPSQLVQ